MNHQQCVPLQTQLTANNNQPVVDNVDRHQLSVRDYDAASRRVMYIIKSTAHNSLASFSARVSVSTVLPYIGVCIYADRGHNLVTREQS